jgi:proline-rich protein PRCC
MLGVEDYGDSDSETQLSEQHNHAIGTGASKEPPQTPSLPRKRGPKKITIGVPNLKDSSEDGPPAAKKTKLQSGAGTSSLLSILPAPKQKATVSHTPQMVLGGRGGPGLVFKTSLPPLATECDSESDAEVAESMKLGSSTLFRPSSLGKGRSNVSLEENTIPPKPAPKESVTPIIDFFSLGTFH